MNINAKIAIWKMKIALRNWWEDNVDPWLDGKIGLWQAECEGHPEDVLRLAYRHFMGVREIVETDYDGEYDRDDYQSTVLIRPGLWSQIHRMLNRGDSIAIRSQKAVIYLDQPDGSGRERIILPNQL